MIKVKEITTLAAIAFSLLLAGPAAAQQDQVAGWDFSQYAGDGLLSVDGASFTNVLDANYSDIAPDPFVGSGAAAFGTMRLDGTFGSTNTPLDGSDPFVPSAFLGSLSSNPDPMAVPFDSGTTLQANGQQFFNLLAMQANAPATVVFEVTPGASFMDWDMVLAARTDTGTATIGVEFSTNGTTFSTLPSISINNVDTAYAVDLDPAGTTSAAYIRLSFDGQGGTAFIDNLSVAAAAAPEPTALVLLGLGLAGLAGVRRRA